MSPSRVVKRPVPHQGLQSMGGAKGVMLGQEAVFGLGLIEAAACILQTAAEGVEIVDDAVQIDRVVRDERLGAGDQGAQGDARRQGAACCKEKAPPP